MTNTRKFPADPLRAKQRTETSRLGFFSQNQTAWIEKSIEVENAIITMFNSNKSLLDIYDYARIKRGFIAQKSETENSEHFGVIRKKGIYGAGNFDLYSPYKSAGSIYNDVEHLNIMKKIILEQNIYATNVWNEPITIKELTRNKIYIKIDDTVKVSKRTIHPKNDNDLTVNMYTSELITNKTETDDIHIRIDWGEMNDEIYKSKMQSLNEQVKNILDVKTQEKDALNQIGLLAYDLCRLMPLKRGTAAVNGWIIRALAKIKGFEIGVMEIKKLPFDIYAEIQANREKYANDFVSAMKKDFSLSLSHR